MRVHSLGRVARGSLMMRWRALRWMLVVRPRRRLLLLLLGSTRRVRVRLRRERLAVGAIERSSGWNTARNSRYGDESRRARRGYGLENAFLIHPRTVLAFASRSTLVAAAANLEEINTMGRLVEESGQLTLRLRQYLHAIDVL